MWWALSDISLLFSLHSPIISAMYYMYMHNMRIVSTFSASSNISAKARSSACRCESCKDMNGVQNDSSLSSCTTESDANINNQNSLKRPFGMPQVLSASAAQSFEALASSSSDDTSMLGLLDTNDAIGTWYCSDGNNSEETRSLIATDIQIGQNNGLDPDRRSRSERSLSTKETQTICSCHALKGILFRISTFLYLLVFLLYIKGLNPLLSKYFKTIVCMHVLFSCFTSQWTIFQSYMWLQIVWAPNKTLVVLYPKFNFVWTKLISVKTSGFFLTQYSDVSDKFHFCRQKSFLSTKAHRIQFRLVQFISVNQNHFCQKRGFLSS